MQTVRTNMKGIASTQYSNYPFTGFCIFNGQIVGAGPGGISKLCTGDDDDGTDIDAYFIPLMSNFGSMNEKRVEFIYTSYQADGNIKVSITGDEKTTIGPYTIITNLTQGQQRRGTRVGRGLSWTYGTLKIENVDGSYFAVDAIQALVNIKSHGVR